MNAWDRAEAEIWHVRKSPGRLPRVHQKRGETNEEVDRLRANTLGIISSNEFGIQPSDQIAIRTSH